MKLQPVNYTRPYTRNNAEQNTNKSCSQPSFKGNPLVAFANFIENNGFMGEFLTIDTVGMMLPRSLQGYGRNMKELGHLNYKAGTEEVIRELLSGPAYFYIPLSVLSLGALIKGKTAKVEAKTLDNLKAIMQNTAPEFTCPELTKEKFIHTIINEKFADYQNERHLIDDIKKIMLKSVEEQPKESGFFNRIKAHFKNQKELKALRKEATEVMTILNKANNKFVNSAESINVGKNGTNISTFLKDMNNYLDEFTKKAVKTKLNPAEFIEKFHKNAKNFRYATNIAAISALSAFMWIIPTLYKTGEVFPGEDGLKKHQNTTPDNQKKEAV